MSTLEALQISKDLLLTTLLLAGPAVIVSMAVGLVISILQTVTSVQEQTLTFAPRIVMVGLMMVVALPWTLQVAMSFSYRMIALMTEVTR